MSNVLSVVTWVNPDIDPPTHPGAVHRTIDAMINTETSPEFAAIGVTVISTHGPAIKSVEFLRPKPDATGWSINQFNKLGADLGELDPSLIGTDAGRTMVVVNPSVFNCTDQTPPDDGDLLAEVPLPVFRLTETLKGLDVRITDFSLAALITTETEGLQADREIVMARFDLDALLGELPPPA